MIIGDFVRPYKWLIGFFLILFIPTIGWSSSVSITHTHVSSEMTTSLYGYGALALFFIGYVLVLGEELTQLRKSKPIIIAAGFIWLLVGLAYANQGDYQTAGDALRHSLMEYAELFLFLLAAMTFINTMEERHVFVALRSWLMQRHCSLRQLYWITGGLAFILSSIANNLSTGLLMGAVIMAIGRQSPQFIAVGCINIVVAANAGGAFSPFGDITTLMVWQKGVVPFSHFFTLFIPALINWLIPAVIMSRTIHANACSAPCAQQQPMKPGGIITILLFVGTIILTVASRSFLYLPPVIGMMTGLGILKIYLFYLCRHEHDAAMHHLDVVLHPIPQDHTDIVRRFDIFRVVERSSWDTLMFFYGIVLCIGGLSTLGYLTLLSEQLYGHLGVVGANSLVGLLSALIDNIPVMLAVLTMAPEMNTHEWLLVTLTTGVGGSLLSIGSAAGIALMGQAQGVYTFYSHLRWSWAIALGYCASILAHLLINGGIQ